MVEVAAAVGGARGRHIGEDGVPVLAGEIVYGRRLPATQTNHRRGETPEDLPRVPLSWPVSLLCVRS